MSYARSKRISEEIKKVVSSLIMTELKDPRVSKLTTVTHVETTRDLSFSYIYISVFDDDMHKKSTIEGLNKAKGFIRREIGKRVKLRIVPEPIFRLDESIENGIHMSAMINEVVSKHNPLHDQEVEEDSEEEEDDE
ncbi:MAG: 30S ribosome-binding factor RbfA [Clostridia bacterium]|nr:30S ribosome-binding factor RbfA [Clostridia bacterium]